MNKPFSTYISQPSLETSPAGTKPFHTYISQSSLDFCPGGTPTKFWVAVQNNSSDYASFQIDLQSAGEDRLELRSGTPSWYRLMSGDSYNIPPKDCIKFEVEILTLPPGREGFVGILFLQANISSLELDHHDSQILKLCVIGMPPELSVDKANLTASPGDQIGIAVELKNPNDQPISMTLRLKGLDDWLTQTGKNLILKPSATQTVTFPCQIPSVTQAHEGDRIFSAEVLQAGTVTVSEETTLKITQSGQVILQCDTPHQQVPTQAGRWLNRHPKRTTFTLNFTNQSNVPIQDKVEIQPILPRRRFWPTLLPRQSKILNIEQDPPILELSAAQKGTSQVKIDYRPPWFGWGAYQEFQIHASQMQLQRAAQIQDPQKRPTVAVQNETPILSLTILPVISRWLQGLGLLGLLILSWILLFQGHKATITYAQFPHQIENHIEQPTKDDGHQLSAHNVISGAENGTLLVWPLRSNLSWLLNQYFSPYNPERKAIEVVRYSPDNRLVAVGFNNGEIDIYEDWTTDKVPTVLRVEEPDRIGDTFEGPCYAQERYLGTPDTYPQVYSGDRVYDLVFSADRQSLYSAHGSGRILQWNLADTTAAPECLQRAQNNAVTTMTLVKQGNKSFLAVAGQRNHLNLLPLDRSSNPAQTLTRSNPRKPVSKNNHITSLASPPHNPSFLAAGDDQGTITLWNLNACIDSFNACEPSDFWKGHDDAPIRSIAFSDDRCYLASAADDGQVKLWTFMSDTDDGTATLEHLPVEEVVRRSYRRRSRHPFKPRPLETVDLWRSGTNDMPSRQDTLFIVSGGEDRQVRLQKRRIHKLNRTFGRSCSPQ